MAVLKKIGIASFAKIYGVIGLIMGFIMGLMTAVFGGLLAGASGFAGFGILAIIILPIFYGILMAIMGAVGAFVYNVLAGVIGGIELELQ